MLEAERRNDLREVVASKLAREVTPKIELAARSSGKSSVVNLPRASKDHCSWWPNPKQNQLRKNFDVHDVEHGGTGVANAVYIR
jgi:hypothetical protein